MTTIPYNHYIDTINKHIYKGLFQYVKLLLYGMIHTMFGCSKQVLMILNTKYQLIQVTLQLTKHGITLCC